MGMNESTAKIFTEPLNNLIGNCGHSDCKTRCGNCFEVQFDTTHPALQPREDTRDSMSSSITKIVERHEAAR
jgi:hypothetical protein